MQKDNTNILHEQWSATLNNLPMEDLTNPSYKPNLLKTIYYKYPKHIASEYKQNYKNLARYPPTQFYNLDKVDHNGYLKSRKMDLCSTNQVGDLPRTII